MVRTVLNCLILNDNNGAVKTVLLFFVNILTKTILECKMYIGR